MNDVSMGKVSFVPPVSFRDITKISLTRLFLTLGVVVGVELLLALTMLPSRSGSPSFWDFFLVVLPALIAGAVAFSIFTYFHREEKQNLIAIEKWLLAKNIALDKKKSKNSIYSELRFFDVFGECFDLKSDGKNGYVVYYTQVNSALDENGIPMVETRTQALTGRYEPAVC